MTALAQRRCTQDKGAQQALSAAEVAHYVGQLNGWQANEEATEIECTFAFKDYYQTLAFVNAIAWMAHQEKHHPDLEVSYNRCVVHYCTHCVDGLTENDFICAAKVDAIADMAMT